MNNYKTDYDSEYVRKYVKPDKDSYHDYCQPKKSPDFKKYCEFGALSNFEDSQAHKIYEIPVLQRSQVME